MVCVCVCLNIYLHITQAIHGTAETNAYILHLTKGRQMINLLISWFLAKIFTRRTRRKDEGKNNWRKVQILNGLYIFVEFILFNVICVKTMATEIWHNGIMKIIQIV